jgi:hypothetical protein
MTLGPSFAFSSMSRTKYVFHTFYEKSLSYWSSFLKSSEFLTANRTQLTDQISEISDVDVNCPLLFHPEQHCFFFSSFRVSIDLGNSIHQTLWRTHVSIGWDREVASILGIRKTYRIWRDSGLTETRVEAAAREKQKVDLEWITRDNSGKLRYYRLNVSGISKLRSQKLSRLRILSYISTEWWSWRFF